MTSTTIKRPGTTIGGYFSNRLRVAAPLVLEVGVRYDHASYTKDTDVSPRVNALVRLSERASSGCEPLERSELITHCSAVLEDARKRFRRLTPVTLRIGPVAVVQ